MDQYIVAWSGGTESPAVHVFSTLKMAMRCAEVWLREGIGEDDRVDIFESDAYITAAASGIYFSITLEEIAEWRKQS